MPGAKKMRSIKRCSRCALPETFPGVKFDESGVCNYCIYHEINKEREMKSKEALKKEFISIIKQTKKRRNKYDCIVAFSGGKDSTFLLQFLKSKFKLKILAHTFDNSFISKKAIENMGKVTKALRVDHRVTKADFSILKELFAYALKGNIPYPKEILAMLSPVCATCLGMVFGSTIKLAIKLKIPLMFIGFTPGQYPAISLENFFKVKSCMFLSSKVYKDDPVDIIKIIRDPIDEQFGGKVEKYFFKSQYIEKGLKVPTILFPFHIFLDYDEKTILKVISRLGWVKPEDTDTCSTNCLLNTIGNYACLKQLKYHPYIGEMSLLVREGKISRKEAIKAEKVDENSFAMRYSLKKLELNKKGLN